MAVRCGLLFDFNQVHARLILVHRVQYNVSRFVHFVVCQFDFLKRDHLAREKITVEGRIGVGIETRLRGWIRLAGHLPTGFVIRIPITLVVNRYNVHGNGITSIRV